MELLNQIFENSQFPILSAFVLGLMTAISPCPLATNITAIGYISKDIQNKRKVFVNGLIYTLGRTIAYTLLGAIFFFGLGKFNIAAFMQQWGEKILGPLLIIIGLFMLGIINIKISGLGSFTERLENKNINFWNMLLLGIAFALAFCPYSGVLYFGILIPMTVSSVAGLSLPIIFALATGIPVIIFAWIIAFSFNSINTTYVKIKNFEAWFRKAIAVLFIGVGIYYIVGLF